MLLEFFRRFKRGSRSKPRRRSVRPKSAAKSGDPLLGQETGKLDGHGQSGRLYTHRRASFLEIPGGSNNAVGSGGFFANSSSFVVNRSNLIDIHDQRFIQNIVNNVNTGLTGR